MLRTPDDITALLTRVAAGDSDAFAALYDATSFADLRASVERLESRIERLQFV